MLKDNIRRLMDRSAFVQRKRAISTTRQIDAWRAAGSPLPIPHGYKAKRVRQIAQEFDCKVFVETGTCLGDMVHAVRDCFGAIHTIELSPLYAARSRTRLGWMPHLTIYEGDSGEVLPSILGKLRVRSLFWLDAHYSGELTATGAEHTPIGKELAAVAGRDDCILIDDAREFIGDNGYPTIEQLRALVRQLLPHHSFRVADNMIEVLPSTHTQ